MRLWRLAEGKWFSRWWRGIGLLLQQGRVFFKWDCALVARIKFFLSVKWLALRAGQRQGGVFRLPPPYLWTPLSPQRVKGCSPLTNPKKKSKHKNASRFAKTGCGAQRPLRALSGTRVLLTAAPTAPPCIRRRRRSSLLRIFLCFSHLRLRRKCHLSAELHALQGRNTSCEAASRRNEKKAFSAAASFFPFRPLLRGLKGASSPFLVPPAPRK